jgi:hypothetical protein
LQREFALFREIETDYEYKPPKIFITPSATGLGTHIRWVYPDTTFSGVHDQSFSSQSSTSDGIVPEDDKCRTPGSPTRATPSPPKPTSRPRVVADTDMTFQLHIKKDEDVEEALLRHIELYVMESENRKHENHRRVYEFVKTRPHLLMEIGGGKS